MNDSPARFAGGTVADYLGNIVRCWIGLPRDAPIPVPTIPGELARLLLRTEESENPHRDQWGCWEHSFSENYLRGRLWVPEIDEWVTKERSRLSSSVPLAPLWPNRCGFAVCLTHDVDMVSRQATPTQVARSIRGAIVNGSPQFGRGMGSVLEAGKMAARGLFWGTSRWPTTADSLDQCLEIEQRFGVRSSYFFTVFPPAAVSHFDCVYRFDDRCLFRGHRMRIADVIKVLAADGHDIGLHGSYQSAVLPHALGEERERLETASGLRVRTTRQHYLHFDMSKTPQLQEAAGLTADSTLGFNRNVGFRAGTSLPYRLFDGEHERVLNVLEVPLVVQEGALLGQNALELDLALGKRVVLRLLEAVASVGGVLTVLFHPHSFVRSEYKALYEWCLGECVNRGAWITSLRELEVWWRDRERRLGVEWGA